jgi:pyridoxine 5-phosphate synthase
MSKAPPLRLGVNVDHVATLRNARPDPVRAARLAIEAGADGITAHLREDRRHIRDEDMARLKAEISKPLNFEMAATADMLRISLATKPHAVCLVPERREELTTEGGLDVAGQVERVGEAVRRIAGEGIEVSLFIDPDPRQVEASVAMDVAAVELHTGRYADAPEGPPRLAELEALRQAAAFLVSAGVELHAGHGLNYRNVGPVARLDRMAELNIGHSIVSRAVFVGLTQAVREMRDCISRALLGPSD